MLNRQRKMRNINEVILSGNTVNTPATREFDGTKYADITIASNRKAHQKADGTWENTADFIPCSLSGKLAERVADLPKGSSVTLRGSLESTSYQKDDKTVHGLRVHVIEIISVLKKDASTGDATVDF